MQAAKGREGQKHAWQLRIRMDYLRPCPALGVETRSKYTAASKQQQRDLHSFASYWP